jgi:P27 family predicted phage terminase small subunit
LVTHKISQNEIPFFESNNMPGRRPKPASVREAEGNPGHRPIPTPVDFTAADSIPKPPTWLDSIAKSEYKRIVRALSDLDLLKATDLAVLASYAVAFSRWVTAEKKIAAEGTVLRVMGSQGQDKFVKNPALMVSSDAQKQLLRAGALLGLNPVDRGRLNASPKQLSNPFAALMGGDDPDDL